MIFWPAIVVFSFGLLLIFFLVLLPVSCQVKHRFLVLLQLVDYLPSSFVSLNISSSIKNIVVHFISLDLWLLFKFVYPLFILIFFFSAPSLNKFISVHLMSKSACYFDCCKMQHMESSLKRHLLYKSVIHLWKWNEQLSTVKKGTQSSLKKNRLLWIFLFFVTEIFLRRK